MSQKFLSEVNLQALNNATTDTDKFLVSDSGTIKYRTGAEVLSDIGGQAALTNPVTGTGTTNYVTKFTGTSTIGNSQLFDNGTNVGIGTTSPSGKLDVIGNLYTSGELRIGASYAATGTGLIKSNSGVLSLFTWGDSTNIQIGGNDVIFKSESGSERMRLTSAGNLGIGVSAPGYKTQIETASSVVFLSKNTSSTSFNRSYFYNNSDVGIQIQAYGSAYPFGTTWPGGANSADITCNAANGLSIGTSTASAFVFGTNSAERMRIDSSGNILVGQTSAIYSATNRANLTIGKSAGSILVLGTSTASNGYLFFDTTNVELANSTASGSVFFRTAGTERMRINSSGNVGIGTTSPTAKLHIADINKVFDGYGNINVFTTDAASTSIGGSIALGGANTTTGTTPYVFGKIQGIKEGSASSWNGALLFGTTQSNSAITEKMRITSTGNVGIGTSSPSGRLQVSSATAGDDQIWLQSTTYTGGYSTLGYNANTGEFRIKQNDGGSAGITFYTGASASEKMRITPAGNVGIGTTSPTQPLEVNGTILSTTGSSGTIALGATTVRIEGNASSREMMFYTFNSERMRITSGGDVGIGTSSPTAKLMALSNGAGWTGWIENQDTAGNGSGLVVRAASNSGGFTMLLQKQDATSTFAVTGSGNVGIGTAAPDASAVLNLESTTQGFLLPRMGDTEMNNISSPAQGLMIFNLSVNAVCVFDGSTWQRLAYL
jgi:hypothetical protein